MSITVDTDSYISVAEATTILDDFFDVDNWTDATTDNKEKALKQATRNIDSLYYLGAKYDLEQALEFPRSFINYAEGETALGTVNDKIKIAQALEALKILDDRANGEDQVVVAQSKGIKSQSVEGTSVSYSELAINKQLNKTNTLKSSEAKQYLKSWIQTVFSRW